jgi:vancomycin resistance protein YoaR
MKSCKPISALLSSCAAFGSVAGFAGAQQLPAPAGSAPPSAWSTPASTPAPRVNPYGLPAPAGSSLAPATPSPRPSASRPSAPRPSASPTTKSAPALASVGGITVSDLPDAAALRVLKRELGPELDEKIALFDGQTTFWRKRRDLGAALPYAALLNDARALAKSGRGGDVPVRFTVDLPAAIAAIKKLAGRIEKDPDGSPRLDVVNGRAVVLNDERVEMAINGSAWRVKAALEHRPPQQRAELVVKRTTVSSKLAQFRYLLAEFSTPFDSGNKGRTRNLKMSAENINGTIVAPGATFSTNHAIGPRNAAAGWREAKMFVSGQVVDGVGAGICQAATTIYNAALLSGLPIAERHQHSFRVSYAPASRDATIYWGSKDMKFRNDTGGAIYVQTLLRGERYVVRLFGTKPLEREVTIESKVLSRQNGTRSEAYRTIRTAQGEKTERLSRDYYKPAPAH